MAVILNILVVFSLTLILTKSRVLAGKREFVEQRYEASKVGPQNPTWVHRIWHALWTCPMCSGFWMAIPVCFFCPAYGIFIDVSVVFGANWLVHCVENLLFFSGKFAETLSDIDFEGELKNRKEFRHKFSNSTFMRLIEKKLKNSLDSRDQ